MPTVKISNSDNKGGCDEFINKLESKSAWKPDSWKESFFCPSCKFVSKYDVIPHINHYSESLRKDDPKFYTISISFSVEELRKVNSENIKDCIEALREFVSKKVMAEYAKGFHLKPDEILWYGKVDWEPITRNNVPVYDIEINIIVSAIDMFRMQPLFVNTTNRKDVQSSFDVKRFREEVIYLFDPTKKMTVSEAAGAATDADF